MKTSSDARPLRRGAAMNCLLVNQLATPGLGSLMGRRIIPGLVQISLAVMGFIFFLGWFVQMAMKTYRLISDLPEQPEPYPWLGKVGVLIFGAAWLLAWTTSISLVRNALPDEVNEPAAPAPTRPLPPKL